MKESRDGRWSKKVKEKYYGKCPHCLSEDGSAHHIIGRTEGRTRYVLENGIYCCNTLHRLFERPGKEELEQIMFYVGSERYSALVRISKGFSVSEDEGFEEII